MRLLLAPIPLLLAAPRLLAPLALAAAALALAVPSPTLAAHSDLLLALLVLVTALGVPAGELRAVREHAGAVAALAVGPTIAFAPLAWLIGRGFGPATRDGLLAVGLSSTEVAAVALVALAGADAAIALGAVTGSLIVAALAGPPLIGVLSGHAVQGGAGHLLGRFALVVIVPLAAGILVRSGRPALAAGDAAREAVAALTVAVLVYAALSGTAGTRGLGSALAGAVLLLAAGGLLGAAWRWRTAPSPIAIAGALAIGMRDFAVAAALAAQAFGPRAAAVPGVYGVVVLVAGALVSARLAATSRRGRAAAGRRVG